MRLRKLQSLDDDDTTWVDEGYAYQQVDGAVVFAYNVISWGRVGAALNVKLQRSGTPLEAIETIIPPGERLRWLPVEVITEENADAYLEALDNACGFPKPKLVPKTIPG